MRNEQYIKLRGEAIRTYREGRMTRYECECTLRALLTRCGGNNMSGIQAEVDHLLKDPQPGICGSSADTAILP